MMWCGVVCGVESCGVVWCGGVMWWFGAVWWCGVVVLREITDFTGEFF